MSNQDDGRYWKRRREDAGFDQDEVAEMMGFHRVTLSRYESGARPIPPLVKEALGALYAIREDIKQRQAPAPLSDYWRGVLYAAEAMAETTHRLLKEAREGGMLDNSAEIEAGAVSRSAPPVARRAAR